MGGSDVRKTGMTVILILLALCASRFVAIAILDRLGLGGEALFSSADDRFADGLKVALAQTAVTAPLWHDPDVTAWPALAQHFLKRNHYLQPGMTIQHLPPLSTLLFMGIAQLFFWMSPTAIVGALVTAYGTASAGLGRAIERLTSESALLPGFALMFVSFPALFMFDRGNFHSGFTSLLVVFYMFTAFCGRWRWVGWLALALAGNIRPNVGLIALLEFGRGRSIGKAATGLVAIGVLGAAIGLSSLALAMRIDPTYSLQAFIRGYAWYDAGYVKGMHGMAWNLSLSNLPKLINAVLGRKELYDPVLAGVLTLFGGLTTLCFVALYALRRIAAERLLFALTVIIAIFTPVFAEYHVLIFAGPLLILVLHYPQALAPRAMWRGAAVLAALQMACLLFALVPTDGILVLAALLALAFPLLARRAFGEGAKDGETEFVIALACLAALSPLGGAISQGVTVGLLLLSALGWLAWRSRAVPEVSCDDTIPRTASRWT